MSAPMLITLISRRCAHVLIMGESVNNLTYSLQFHDVLSFYTMMRGIGCEGEETMHSGIVSSEDTGDVTGWLSALQHSAPLFRNRNVSHDNHT
jgi:hypothetical protein